MPLYGLHNPSLASKLLLGDLTFFKVKMNYETRSYLVYVLDSDQSMSGWRVSNSDKMYKQLGLSNGFKNLLV